MIIKRQNRTTEQNSVVANSQSTQPQPVQEEEQVDIFDLDNIDFSQRQERRRGDRRRGYRRIDDRSLISRAQEEAEIIKETAAKEGYRAGIEQAQADIENLRNAIASIIGSKQEVFDYIAPDILELSVEIAQKIIKKELQQDPTIVLETIMDVMKTLSKEESRVTIRVNPDAVDIVKSELPDRLDVLGLEVRITVASDDSIEEGGCIIYTSNGIVDANIPTQLDILKEALKGV